MTRTKIVNGERVPLTAEEEAQRDAEEAAWASGAVEREREVHNRPIIEQIKILDTKRIRPLAEGDTAYLENLNKQIATLRAQLK